MELGLYTDSLREHTFVGALDVAARFGATGIQIATETDLERTCTAVARFRRELSELASHHAHSSRIRA